MKRYIRSASKHGNRQPKTQYIYKVCDAMGWNYPMFKDPTSTGYKCKWERYSLVSHELRELVGRKLFGDYGLEWDGIRDAPYDEMEADGMDNDAQREVIIQTYSSLRPEAVKVVEGYVDEIYKKTGIKCRLNIHGDLVIPYGPDEWED